MQQESARKILAASFATPDGGSRGAGALEGPSATRSATPPSSTSGRTARRSSSSRRTGARGAVRSLAVRSASSAARLGSSPAVRLEPSSRSCAIPVQERSARAARQVAGAQQLGDRGRDRQRRDRHGEGTARATRGTELRRGRSRRERCVALRAGRGARGRARAGCDVERVFQLATGSSGANFDRLSPRDRGGARGTRRPHDRREPARLHTGLCAERGLSNSSSSRRHALAIVPFKPIPG